LWWAEASETGAGLEQIVPGWLTDLGWIGMAILAVWAFATNRVYTAGQVERLLEAERRVAKVWEENAKEDQKALSELMHSLEPIAAGNEAVLKAIEGLKVSRDRSRRS
jgi:hypothetical protein